MHAVRLLVAGLVLAALAPAARAAPCGRPDLIGMVPPDGAGDIPPNATLSAFYQASADYLGEDVVLVTPDGVENVLPATFDATEAKLSITPPDPLSPRGNYVVRWPALRGLNATTPGLGGRAQFSVAFSPDAQPPTFEGLVDAKWDLQREESDCTDSVLERFVFDLELGAADDDGGRDGLTLIVFQTAGAGEAPASVPVLTRPLPASGIRSFGWRCRPTAPRGRSALRRWCATPPARSRTAPTARSASPPPPRRSSGAVRWRRAAAPVRPRDPGVDRRRPRPPPPSRLPEVVKWIACATLCLLACNARRPPPSGETTTTAAPAPVPPPPFTCDGGRCAQQYPAMPDDGDWTCVDSAGATICVGGERPAGVAPAPGDPRWACGARRGPVPDRLGGTGFSQERRARLSRRPDGRLAVSNGARPPRAAGLRSRSGGSHAGRPLRAAQPVRRWQPVRRRPVRPPRGTPELLAGRRLSDGRFGAEPALSNRRVRRGGRMMSPAAGRGVAATLALGAALGCRRPRCPRRAWRFDAPSQPIGFDTSFSVVVRRACPELAGGRVAWRQIDGAPLPALVLANDGFVLTARTPPLAALLGGPAPWGVIPLSPAPAARPRSRRPGERGPATAAVPRCAARSG